MYVYSGCAKLARGRAEKEICVGKTAVAQYSAVGCQRGYSSRNRPRSQEDHQSGTVVFYHSAGPCLLSGEIHGCRDI